MTNTTYQNSRRHGLEAIAEARARFIKGEGSARYWQRYLTDVRQIHRAARRAHLERCWALAASAPGREEEK